MNETPLTTEEVRDRLGLSRQRVNQLRLRGALRVAETRPGGRGGVTYLFDPESVAAYAKRDRRPGPRSKEVTV